MKKKEPDIKTLFNKYLPYILIILNGGSAVGGGLYQGNKVEDQMATTLSIVTIDMAKNFMSYEDKLREDFENRIKMCKDTRGKVCKIK